MEVMAANATVNSLAEFRKQQALDLLARTRLLPTTLHVPMRILKMQRSSSAGMAEVAQVLAADAGLSAKVLALANSAAFSPVNPVTRLSQALAMIGMKNLMPLVFGLSLAGIFNELSLPPSERDALWKASLLKATAARELAKWTCPEMAEEAFLAGLLQDLALPLMHAADRSVWQELLSIVELADGASRVQRERKLYAMDHTELGALLVRRIGLPDVFVHMTATHHADSAVPASHALGPALELAAALPHRLAPGGPGSMQALTAKLRSMASTSTAPHDLLKAVSQSYQTSLAALGDADEASGAFKQFLQTLCAEVAQTMEGAIGDSTSTITQLSTERNELAEMIEQLKKQAAKSEYDELTTTLTRTSFLSRGHAVLLRATERQVACCVAFIDLDDFKRINDDHGHEGGDHALAEAGKRLSAAVQGHGLAGRVGGDELAFVVVGTADAAPEIVAENVVNQIRAFPVTMRGGKVERCAASVGLVSLGIPQPKDRIEDALRQADTLMYASKRAGNGGCKKGSYSRAA